jgi:ABC-2 type transport system ATP-binding protein
VVRDAAELERARGILGPESEVDADNRRVSVPAKDRLTALTHTARALEDAGIAVEDIGLRRPTLDEVFLELTGGAAK